MKSTIFITESGEKIGFGHLYRSIALAQMFLSQGYKVTFLCDDVSGVTLINTKIPLANVFSIKEFPQHISLHSILIIDVHFGSFKNFEEVVKKYPGKSATIIDHTFRKYALKTDFIFEIAFQNYDQKKEMELLPSGRQVTKFSGNDFFMFREEFINVNRFVVKERADKILVTMGGSDPDRITEKMLESISLIKRPLSATFILGPGIEGQRVDSIKLMAACRGFRICQNAEDLVDEMLNHDIAIINGGNTRFELALIGTPFLSISLNARQHEISAHISEAGIGKALGINSELTPETIAFEVAKLLDDFSARKHMSDSMIKLISVGGCYRIFEYITS
jgi:UDP-2,4-diacetamido-2,4,6-trideoxy-beta-L-altropyranose hydrolase